MEEVFCVKSIIHVFALVVCFSISGYAQAQGSLNSPYAKDISSYPKDWKGREFICAEFNQKYDWIPEFTLGPYSDPNNSELKELCRCIDKDSPSWVKDTSRKMKNKDEVSWMYKRGFPSSFGGSMRLCTENK
jgi:hypothetical protein